jgi:hypothetical protein
MKQVITGAFVSLLAAAALPVAGVAATALSCTLNAGCGTSDCGADAEISATLEPSGDGWILRSNSEIAGRFSEIGETSGTRHFVSTDIDPDAGAAALLSVFANGVALLSLHGTFMVPTGEIYNGRCTAETG